ncbi:MAG: hypothetical protein D3906_11815 [Candidatus Electrothrix sp. AUS1_2]|nr:hypothetical protein [Candidatus Electrothrix sp. AUS1_2]
MDSYLTQVQKVKEELETVAFLISKGGSEREAHGKIVESLVLLSQLETRIKHECSNDSFGDLVGVSASNLHSYNSKSKDEADQEVNKIHRRLPRWFRNPRQYNSTILISYLKLSEERQKVSVQTLRDDCKSVKDFNGNYNQMKNFGENNHGKVFEERDGYVTLWEPVREFVLQLYNENKA